MGLGVIGFEVLGQTVWFCFFLLFLFNGLSV